MPSHHRRIGSKGVEFSDHLTVFGPSHTISEPQPSPALPPSRSSYKRRAKTFDAPPSHLDPHNSSATSLLDPADTLCVHTQQHTVDDDSPSFRSLPDTNRPYLPMDDKLIDRRTRINTQLNSLPSGGAFSLMNSSEDVDSSSSSDDDSLRGSRKMIRVDGSAKLSTASGFNDDDPEDDSFSIEGAEKVDEEEDVNVRSFGRTLAQARLEDQISPLNSPIVLGRDARVAFAELPRPPRSPPVQRTPRTGLSPQPFVKTSPSAHETTTRHPSGLHSHRQFAESRSTPPRRKSRLRLTFTRKSSAATARRSNTSDEAAIARLNDMNSVEMSGLSCFPLRRATTKMRVRNDEVKPPLPPLVQTIMPPEAADAGHSRSLISLRRNETRPGTDAAASGSATRPNRIVKNVSMQRDDWIDFTTNVPTKQRSMWLSRLVSSNVASGSDDLSSERSSLTSQEPTRRKNSFWKFWRRR